MMDVRREVAAKMEYTKKSMEDYATKMENLIEAP